MSLCDASHLGWNRQRTMGKMQQALLACADNLPKVARHWLDSSEMASTRRREVSRRRQKSAERDMEEIAVLGNE